VPRVYSGGRCVSDRAVAAVQVRSPPRRSTSTAPALVNPSPYMFYLVMGERKIIGTSPERLSQRNRASSVAPYRRTGRVERHLKRTLA